MDIRSVSAAYGAIPYQSSSKSSKKEAPEKSAAVPKEQVEISDISKNLKTVKESVGDLPDVRLEIVEQIRNKIKYNGYPIESNMYKAIEKLVSEKII